MRFDSGLLAHVGDVERYPQVDEWTEIAKLLESAGYTAIWAAEHHFSYDPGSTPTPTNPLMVGAFLASQTKTLRVGQCGVAMPAWHPLRVAEDAAMLDHMSRGRLEFGFMKGLHGKVSTNFDVLADRTRNHEETNADVMWEAFDIVKKWWSGEPFNHEGKYFKFPHPWRARGVPAEYLDPTFYNEDAEMIRIKGLPIPYQKPLPPCWVMSDSVSSTVRAAKAGVGAICWANTFEGAKEVWEAYRTASEEAADAGTLPRGANRRTAMMRPTFVAKDHETLETVMRPAVNRHLKVATLGLEHWMGRKAMLPSWQDLTEQDLKDDWYDFTRRHHQIIVGTPEEVTEILKRYEEEAGCDHYVQYWALPGISFEQMTGSVKLMADKVMPHFSDSRPKLAVAGT